VRGHLEAAAGNPPPCSTHQPRPSLRRRGHDVPSAPACRHGQSRTGRRVGLTSGAPHAPGVMLAALMRLAPTASARRGGGSPRRPRTSRDGAVEVAEGRGASRADAAGRRGRDARPPAGREVERAFSRAHRSLEAGPFELRGAPSYRGSTTTARRRARRAPMPPATPPPTRTSRCYFPRTNPDVSSGGSSWGTAATSPAERQRFRYGITCGRRG
jgi:hypothetical protein